MKKNEKKAAPKAKKSVKAVQLKDLATRKSPAGGYKRPVEELVK